MYITEFISHLAIATGDNVILYNPESGDSQVTKVPPPEVPPNLTKGQLEVLNKEDRPICSIATSRNVKQLAVATKNKQIVIFNSELNVTKNFIVKRAASALLFTSSGDILVADRTGDVYSYQLSCGTTVPTLLLGHPSMILDMILSECEKYIITCDRDEKIRVAHFPNTYNIASYCLGHKEYVKYIKVIENHLVSASGDGTIRIWDYVNGKQLSFIDTNQYVLDDKKILNDFAERMDKEKVDVRALPIIDMQVSDIDKVHFKIAVSLQDYPVILIFKLDKIDYKPTVDTIPGVDKTHKFYLFSDRELFVFYDSSVTYYKCKLNNWHHVANLQLEHFQEMHKDILKMTKHDDTVLYKRRYDNVQEYMERKKLRLESKE